MITARSLLHVTLVGPALLAPLTAQENLEMGKMWTFENPPVAYLEEQYDFSPDQEWLTALRLASLRMDSGCSASFVSPNGLVMTNHHCVRDLVAEVQDTEDWVTGGFYAETAADELKLDVTLQQLVRMEDVTEAMNEGIEDGMEPDAVAVRREENRKAVIERAGEEHPDLTPQVVALYQGAIHQLYLYRDYEDVRLVMAPHLQTAHFGGDPDNFTYPRYSIDFAFVRLYEDGEPVDSSEHYFEWGEDGPQEGELTFVTGNPGTTKRLHTLAQLGYQRDVKYPIDLAFVRSQLEILKTFVEENPRFEKQFKTGILRLENTDKAYTGQLGGLEDPELMAHKARAEEAFRERLAADPEAAEKYGDVWDGLADVAAKRREVYPKTTFYSPLLSNGALASALAVLEAVDPETGEEEAKAAADRARQATERNMNPLQAPIFAGHLDRAKEWLGADDPYVKVLLGDGNGAQAVRALLQSPLASTDYVEQLLAGGQEAVDASDDIALHAAKVLRPLLQRAEARSEKLDEREEVLGSRIGRALFAAYGTSVSPDATFTLRFSDGLIEGYPYNGTIAPWRTSFHGLYDRNASFGGEHPYDLPQPWIDRMERLDMSRGVCFVSTNDIVGGNSGSPIVDADLEIVGLIFDGNIESLPNTFLYSSEAQRSVSVHVHAIEEAMRAIYEAERVLAELGLQKEWSER